MPFGEVFPVQAISSPVDDLFEGKSNAAEEHDINNVMCQCRMGFIRLHSIGHGYFHNFHNK